MVFWIVFDNKYVTHPTTALVALKKNKVCNVGLVFRLNESDVAVLFRCLVVEWESSVRDVTDLGDVLRNVEFHERLSIRCCYCAFRHAYELQRRPVRVTKNSGDGRVECTLELEVRKARISVQFSLVMQKRMEVVLKIVKSCSMAGWVGK